MKKKERTSENSLFAASPSVGASAGEDLLQIYLALPAGKRASLFANTARAARVTGLSRRTIQLWIETGRIKAVGIGKKYYVFLPSLTDYLRARSNKATG